MANYYQSPEMERPSISQELFGSPLKAQWTLQKASMYATALTPGMWNKVMTGHGIRWGGVVGFRGIALGEKGLGTGAVGMRTLSPAKLIQHAIGIFSPDKAQQFSKYGLFGRSEGSLGAIGRFLGGGVIESTKFIETNGPLHFRVTPNEELIRKRANKIWRKGLGGTPQEHWFAAQEQINKETNIIIKKGMKNITKRNIVRKIARVGKFASWAGAASIAFDIGTAVGGLAVNAMASTAERLEKTMSNIINRKMEFGGKVGVGFYSGRSGTERQRALSAIGKGYNGSPGFGNEAGMQHVDSTW
ncbi:MAG TPA: hypothetical protein VI911_10980 [Patescibacteria group bacterium]|nr:hypothetical protein [Patescibacteria group bacterium]